MNALRMPLAVCHIHKHFISLHLSSMMTNILAFITSLERLRFGLVVETIDTTKHLKPYNSFLFAIPCVWCYFQPIGIGNEMRLSSSAHDVYITIIHFSYSHNMYNNSYLLIKTPYLTSNR